MSDDVREAVLKEVLKGAADGHEFGLEVAGTVEDRGVSHVTFPITESVPTALEAGSTDQSVQMVKELRDVSPR